ncbi:SRPBCC family protein [Saccharopolyspora sp. NPDC050389]|uniref:SRPBCC family protein n=1 Tax=Saccharopolyspora sp. NPDC050389 TaxID=3155516 RepID=UPI0033D42B17
MASVQRELLIEATAEEVWSVIRDFGGGPDRMAPGFVSSTSLEDDVRIVTFTDGTVARERLVTIDEEARRIVYAVIGDTLQPVHDNSSMQVLPEGTDHSRLVWIHDVLPDDLAKPLAAAMEQGFAVIKQTLESAYGREEAHAIHNGS